MTYKEGLKRSNKMVSTVHRQWMILKYLSRSAEHKTTEEILDYLTAEGVNQTLRTVQRDLAFLADIFLCNATGSVMKCAGIGYAIVVLS